MIPYFKEHLINYQKTIKKKGSFDQDLDQIFENQGKLDQRILKNIDIFRITQPLNEIAFFDESLKAFNTKKIK